jgi:hypothetical protein
VASDERDREAARLAASWSGRPELGYAAWTVDGPMWVETFVEGEKWTPIPREGRS